MFSNHSRNKAVLLGSLVTLTLGLLTLSVAACSGAPAQTGTQATVPTVPGSSTDQSALLNTITMSGTGTVNTLPDEAVIQVGVENSAATAAAALDANSKKTQKVLDRLKADGVPDSAIETTNVAVYPNTSYDPKTGQGKTTGYQATNMVNVTLTDFKLIGQVFAAATEAGANNVSGPTWQLSENSKAMVEALTKAADNSHAKAEGVAAAEGVKIGQVLIVSETTTQSIVPQAYAGANAASGSPGSVTPPPVSPQNLQVTASLSVTYRLTQ
jgi:uncharacterized protein YggE